MPTALKSKPSNIFLMKVWMPLLCVLISSELFGGKFVVPDILLALPWLIAAAFGVSVAAVEARDGGLRYRRLFKWRTLAIYQRRRPDAWIYAFFTGLLVSYTFHRLLKLV